MQDLEHSETARALTISVLSMPKSLGMTVVAEGWKRRSSAAG